jgi:hypothetical protein
MKVKVNKPVPGMAYFGGEIADLDPKECAQWLASGHMIVIPETEGDENSLPDDLPGREILWKEGFRTLNEIKKVKETLTEIKGIGKKTASDILVYIEK